jgi:Co/Zn/Cd efflux system component
MELPNLSRYRVPAMDCAAEEQLVRMGLDRLDGIGHVSVDLTERIVTVVHVAEADDLDQAMSALGLGAELVERGATDGEHASVTDDPRRERTALGIALAINALFFVGEVTVGLVSGSLGLIADGLDMGADAAVYAISLVAVGGSVARKQRLARTSGIVQLTLAFVGLAEVARRLVGGEEPPDVRAMIVVSLLALAGNVVTLVLLHRFRSGEVHLQASWIFTANDVKVNALVILAAIAVSLSDSAVPDLVAGALIFAIVANGARRILALSR